MLKFRSSAFHHGITKVQIEEVLADRWNMAKWFQIHNDKDGNSQKINIRGVKMPKLTDKERQLRRKKLQEDALQSVMARGQFNFRLDGEDIKRLYELAGRRQEPVSVMVREWVLERLEKEETSKYSAPLWAQEFEQRLTKTIDKLHTLLNKQGFTKPGHF